MAAITSNLSSRRAPGMAERAGRLARVAGLFLAAIGSRWSTLVEAGQLGPDAERSISRHTGARI